jgi:hypothetical protein
MEAARLGPLRIEPAMIGSVAINGLQGDNGPAFLGPKLKNHGQGLALCDGNRDGKPKAMGDGF